MTPKTPDGYSDVDGPLGHLNILGFIADSDAEQIIRDSLGAITDDGFDIQRGNIRTAISSVPSAKKIQVLIVDLSGEEQPLNALAELASIVEPDVTLLAIGDIENIGFYRHITRDLGVTEYIFKPINRDAVARYFIPFLDPKLSGSDAVRGGRVITIIGAHGGVGATTISANLAWYLGVIAKRHTVFVEPDLYLGSGALLLGGKTGTGLRMALEAPDRIDPLFVQRAALSVSEHLSVLAGKVKLTDTLMYEPGAAQRLIEALQLRFNFVIMNVPFAPLPLNREFLEFSHHRVIVSDATLVSMQDTTRLLTLPNGLWQPQSPTLVLNRTGRPGTLTCRNIEHSLKLKFDIVIPDLPEQINKSANLGDPAVKKAGPFREAIAALARQVGFVTNRDGTANEQSISFNSILHRIFL